MYFKAVTRETHLSHYDQKTKWEVGTIVRVRKPDKSSEPCAAGIHLAKTLMDAVRYQQAVSDYFEVEPYGKTWAEDDTKLRCTGAKVIRLISQQEQDEIAGFRLWEMNHPINPLEITRDTSLDLPVLVKEWDSVRGLVRGSVWASVSYSVWDSVWRSVRGSVWASLSCSVRGSVMDAVLAYIGGLFPGAMKWYGIDTSDPWRPLLTLWYGGYVPSFDGITWRLYAGKNAEIVYEMNT